MTNIIIYSTCQGDGIKYYLDKYFSNNYNIKVIRNYSLIINKSYLPIDLIKNADICIYQNMPSKWGRYSTENTDIYENINFEKNLFSDNLEILYANNFNYIKYNNNLIEVKYASNFDNIYSCGFSLKLNEFYENNYEYTIKFEARLKNSNLNKKIKIFTGNCYKTFNNYLNDKWNNFELSSTEFNFKSGSKFRINLINPEVNLEYEIKNLTIKICKNEYNLNESKKKIKNFIDYLKPNCIKIRIPYVFLSALWSLVRVALRDGDNNLSIINPKNEYDYKYLNKEIIINLKKDHTLDNILKLYDDNKINFNYKNNFEYQINILKEKELNTDIKVSNFILKNYKKYKLFHTQNHPTYIILCEMTKQILQILNEDISNLDSIFKNDEYIIGGYVYYSKYDINYYNFEFQCNINDNYIKQIIKEIYNLY